MNFVGRMNFLTPFTHISYRNIYIERMCIKAIKVHSSSNLHSSIKAEALRQLGNMLKENPPQKGRLLRGTILEPRNDLPTLAELGLDKKTSKLAQDIAKLPDEKIVLLGDAFPLINTLTFI